MTNNKMLLRCSLPIITLLLLLGNCNWVGGEAPLPVGGSYFYSHPPYDHPHSRHNTEDHMSSYHAYPSYSNNKPYSHYSHPSEEDSPMSYGKVGGTSGGGGYTNDPPGGSYSPYSGYQPDSWMNTMKGNYDDYGYSGYKSKAPISHSSSPQGGYNEGPAEYNSYIEAPEEPEEQEEQEGIYRRRRPSPPSSNGYGPRRPSSWSYKGPPKLSYGKDTYSNSNSAARPSYGPPKKKEIKGGYSSSYGRRPSYQKESPYLWDPPSNKLKAHSQGSED